MEIKNLVYKKFLSYYEDDINNLNVLLGKFLSSDYDKEICSELVSICQQLGLNYGYSPKKRFVDNKYVMDKRINGLDNINLEYSLKNIGHFFKLAKNYAFNNQFVVICSKILYKSMSELRMQYSNLNIDSYWIPGTITNDKIFSKHTNVLKKSIFKSGKNIILINLSPSIHKVIESEFYTNYNNKIFNTSKKYSNITMLSMMDTNSQSCSGKSSSHAYSSCINSTSLFYNYFCVALLYHLVPELCPKKQKVNSVSPNVSAS